MQVSGKLELSTSLGKVAVLFCKDAIGPEDAKSLTPGIGRVACKCRSFGFPRIRFAPPTT